MSINTSAKLKRKRGIRNVPMVECAYCGEAAAWETAMAHSFRSGEELIVIEKVPTMICDSCGQSYFLSPAWKFVNEVLKHPDKHTEKRMVKVATYP
jgi:YgiT-type zinc finger domain-containing protein